MVVIRNGTRTRLVDVAAGVVKIQPALVGPTLVKLRFLGMITAPSACPFPLSEVSAEPNNNNNIGCD